MTLPLTLITLGFFTSAGFWPALFGALLISVVSWILNGLLISPSEQKH